MLFERALPPALFYLFHHRLGGPVTPIPLKTLRKVNRLDTKYPNLAKPAAGYHSIWKMERRAARVSFGPGPAGSWLNDFKEAYRVKTHGEDSTHKKGREDKNLNRVHGVGRIR